MRSKSSAAETLSDLLLGQTRGRILALLFGAPDQAFFVREISRRTAVSVGTVQRELEKLAHFELILRTTYGRQVFYQANQSHPIFFELRSLVAKTAGVYHLLTEALTPFAGQMAFAFVYGSLANGGEKAGSDVDLMVVGSVPMDDVLMLLSSAEKEIGRAVNPTVYSVSEFRKKLQEGNHFLSAVLRGKKVMLFGDADELGKMGGVRLAQGGAQQP